MWQRIASAVCSCAGLTLILAASPAASAQESSAARSPAVTAATTAEQVRFISFDKITHVRLEVFSPAGERLFDSGFRSGDLLDWGLRDQQGQRLADGSYLCVVTVKDPSGRLGRRHGLVSLRERQVSLQRVAPKQLSAGEARAWADSRAAQSTEAAQESGDLALIDSGDLTLMDEDAPAAMTVAAHDGRDGQVTSTSGALTFRTGDVFAGKEREQMRVTPEGRVGIGTDKPEDALDVAGTIRARGGIRFDDGSVLTSARQLRKAGVTPFDTNAADDTTGTLNATGTGTTNKLAKWIDGAGTLGDSVIFEDASGNIGVGTVAPGGVLDLQRNNAGDILQRFWNTGAGGAKLRYVSGLGATSQMQFTDAAEWLASIATSNQMGIQFRVRGTGTTNSEAQLDASTRMTLARNGNVGIGTTAPASRLEVAGDLRVSGAGNGLVFPDGTKQTTAGGGGGGVSGSGTAGVLPLWSGPTALGDSVITQSAGNVGIGTPATGSRLTVGGVIESTAGGFKFPDGTVQTTRTVQGPAGPTGPTGPQGATGPQGPAGPAGPAVHTTAVCVSGDRGPNNLSCLSRTCSCQNGTVVSVSSPCYVTSDTGPCSASTCQYQSSVGTGMCCVCKP